MKRLARLIVAVFIGASFLIGATAAPASAEDRVCPYVKLFGERRTVTCVTLP